MNISLSFTRFLRTPTLTPPRASISPLPTRRPPPSPRRQKPPPRRRRLPPPNPPLPLPSSCSLECPHFESCSGCTHEVNLQRPEIVDEAEAFFKGFGVDDFSFHSGKLLGWRCRAKLAVRGSSADPVVGLYQEGTHNVVDIPDCKAHHPNINVVIELLKQGIVELNVEPYDEDAGTGELRYVQMAVTTYNTSIPQSERYKNGKVQVTLVWNSRTEISPSFQKLEALANFLWKNCGPKCDFHLIHSVWANFQISTDNVIFGNRWKHLVGNKEFWEHIGGIDASLDPSSFGQANTRAFDSMLHKLQKYVPYGSSVADLYGGSGIIGLSLAATRKCRFVKCIEVNKESKPSFERTLSRLPNYVDCNISWHHADASDAPLFWLLGSDVVVVDPPRKGLDESVILALQSTVPPKHHHAAISFSIVSSNKDEKRPWILRAREASVHVKSKTVFEESHSLPQTLIYISCGWDSFKEGYESIGQEKQVCQEEEEETVIIVDAMETQVLGSMKSIWGSKSLPCQSVRSLDKPNQRLTVEDGCHLMLIYARRNFGP
ncbi:putative RNA methyltransferase pc1998 [Drosera capensis]